GWIESGGEHIMKTVLLTLSVINGLMGFALIGLFIITDDTPLVVVALGVGLLIQAGFVLAYLSGVLEALEPWSLRAILVGETVALLVGFFGFVSSALYNINPPGGDYEYGPLAVAALIGFHAVVALWVFAIPKQAERIHAPQP
ncbi:MAG: hypothetical protein ACE1Y9_01330, partial [Acidimicrobiia bacterium]